MSIRSFQLLGLKKPGTTLVNIGTQANLGYFYIIKFSELYITSFFASMLLLLFWAHKPRTWIVDTPTYQEPGHFSLLTLSVGIISTAVLFLGIAPSMGGIIAKRFVTKPKRCAVLILLVSVLWLIWNFQMSDSDFFKLVAWFYLVGSASIIAAWLVEKGQGLKATDWELRILLAFALLVPWFATGFYGNLKPAFGGGSPVSTKLYLKEESPVFRAKTLDVQILEETEQGYYVLSRPDSKTVVFVPRSSVSTAQFKSQKQ